MTSPWVKALIAFDADPAARVPCPACGEANLRVEDAEVVSDDCIRWSRDLICDACRAYNVASGRRPLPVKTASGRDPTPGR